MKHLIGYLINDPPEDASEQVKYVYPYLVSELLGDPEEKMSNALFTPEILELFLTYVEREGKVQHLYANYVCKTIHTLLCQRSDAVCFVLLNHAIYFSLFLT